MPFGSTSITSSAAGWPRIAPPRKHRRSPRTRTRPAIATLGDKASRTPPQLGSIASSFRAKSLARIKDVESVQQSYSHVAQDVPAFGKTIATHTSVPRRRTTRGDKLALFRSQRRPGKSMRQKNIKNMIIKTRKREAVSGNIAALQTDLALSKLVIKKQCVALDDAQARAAALKDKLLAINNELECPICKETLARPLALYPCGHVFCEACLIQAFCTPRPGENAEITHAQRKKFCPDCRAFLHIRPAPVYLAKSIMSITNPEAVNNESNGFGLIQLGLSEGEDPWDQIFSDDGDAVTMTSDSVYGDLLEIEMDELGDAGNTMHNEGFVQYRAPRSRVWFQDTSDSRSSSTETEGEGGESSETATQSEMMSLDPHDFMGAGFDGVVSDADDNSSRLSDIVDDFTSYNVESHLMDDYRRLESISRDAPNPRFVHRGYEHPTHHCTDTNLLNHLNQRERLLHSRGISENMMRRFRITYNGADGIAVRVGESNIIYLGYNIRLLTEDTDGEAFMDYIRWEMVTHPERWEMTNHTGAAWKAYRLKAVRPSVRQSAYTYSSTYHFNRANGRREGDPDGSETE